MVHRLLLPAVEGTDFVYNEGQNDPQNRGGEHKDQGKARVEEKGQADPHEEHHGAADQGAQSGVDGVLHDGDVCGHTGDQGGSGGGGQVGEKA